jgi:hypothetical protein
LVQTVCTGQSLKDDEHTSWPTTVRNELKIQVAMLVRANCSQIIVEISSAAEISHGTSHNILSDDLNMSRVTQRNDRTSTCSDVIDSADRDGTFLNRTIGDKT